MNALNRTIGARDPIKVIVFTKYQLVRQQIRLLIESKSEIVVQDFASSAADLLEKAAKTKPQVVVFCLMEDEGDNTEVIPELLQVSPETKAIVLSSQNGRLDQKKVLKLGATGIVGADQKEEVLIRAIRQVSQGEVFLNQRLIAQLLDNRSGGNSDTDPDGRHRGLFKNDQLTNRELEVIEEIAGGLTNREISKKLSISEATVRHHLSSIYGKLQVEDRLNLVIYAYQYGIIERSDESY